MYNGMAASTPSAAWPRPSADSDVSSKHLPAPGAAMLQRLFFLLPPFSDPVWTPCRRETLPKCRGWTRMPI